MPATGKPKSGRLCKAYYDADGDIAAPTWIALGKIQGASKNSQRSVAEVDERGFDEVTVLPGSKSREFSITLTRRPNDADYDALETAHESGAKIGLALYTGTITESGERGFVGEVYVIGFDDDQSHDSTAVTATFRTAADYTTAPAIVETA